MDNQLREQILGVCDETHDRFLSVGVRLNNQQAKEYLTDQIIALFQGSLKEEFERGYNKAVIDLKQYVCQRPDPD